jgi:hypothetical protein
MLESQFKRHVKKRITERFPNLDLDFIDTAYRSMPDTFVIGPGVWAALEFKQSEDSSHRPNQDYHILRLNKKGYATYVSPENVEEVLDELEILFSS